MKFVVFSDANLRVEVIKESSSGLKTFIFATVRRYLRNDDGSIILLLLCISPIIMTTRNHNQTRFYFTTLRVLLKQGKSERNVSNSAIPPQNVQKHETLSLQQNVDFNSRRNV